MEPKEPDQSPIARAAVTLPAPSANLRALRAMGLGTLALVALHTPLAIPRAPRPIGSTAPSASAPAVASSTVRPPPPVVSVSQSRPAASSPWRIADLTSDPDLEVIEGTVGRHALLAALMDAGIALKEAHRILKAFEGLRRLDHLNAKDRFAVATDIASGRVVGFELATSPMDVWQVRQSDAGALGGKKLELHVERAPIGAAVTVGDDLPTSVAQAGLDADVLRLLDDALDGRADLTSLRAGARLRIVATEEHVEGIFSRYQTVDAVEYWAATPSATPLRVYWFDPDSDGARRHKKDSGFFDSKGQQPHHGGWRKPVPFARISSRFNPKRLHPVLHVVMPHNGIDFAASAGTPVYATASGVVGVVGDGGPCGNMVQVQHANGLTSVYCHLSKFAAKLHAGQRVETRQLLGYVGQTGRVTGPHLHFAIKRGNVFVDPMTLKLDGIRALPAKYRSAFFARKAQLDVSLDHIALPQRIAKDAGSEPDEVVFEEPP
ncbi:MAG: M23 family metallopeptidase, partial [Myxococcales bacterium]